MSDDLRNAMIHRLRAEVDRLSVENQRLRHTHLGIFEQWSEPGDPEMIAPEVIAARCLGIKYGDPGPRRNDVGCRICYGERYVWYGNAWGLKHVGTGRDGCKHECHIGEIILAATAPGSLVEPTP